MTSTKEEALANAMAAYASRVPMLQFIAQGLERETKLALTGVSRIDRIGFRVKDPESFGRKSLNTDKHAVPKYDFPLSDIEDQLAGRVLVFFRRDINVVVERLKKKFNPAEHQRKEPQSLDSFSYESEHLVFRIPPQVLPDGWSTLDERPATFEMQVRTLFMHAWAEPQHDIGYKPGVQLTDEERRKIAWAAANAWGGDAIFEQLLDSISARSALS